MRLTSEIRRSSGLRTLHLLRSKLLLALVALLILGGYSESMLGMCKIATTHISEQGASDQAPGDSDCQCLCHQSFTNEQDVSPVAGRPVPTVAFVTTHSQSVPEGLPVAIEHPPQLG